MAGNVGSMTDSHRRADSLLLDPSCRNAVTSTETADMCVAVSTSECLHGALDGPCSSLPVTVDGEPLPPSCVVEDDELLTSPSRHHHRHYRRHRSGSRRHHRFCRVKWKEVNFLAAMLNIVAAVLVCTALAEPRWWYIGGSSCLNYDQSATYLGVKQFLYKGFFVHRSTSSVDTSNKYYYGTLQTEVLENCVTPQTVYVIKAIIALCFIVISLCLMAVLFDIVIFSNRCLKAIRRHAVLSILAVCTCVTVNGLSYLVTQQLMQFYQSQSSVDVTALNVEFSFCFYIIMAAGIACVFSVAFSLLCRRSCYAAHGWCPDSIVEQAGSRRRRDERLIDADFNQVCASVGTSMPVSASPPPYAP